MENNEIVTWLGFLVTAYGLFPYGLESILSIVITTIVGLTLIFVGFSGRLGRD